MTTALRSTLLSRRDLQFLLHEWLGVEDLPEYGEVLELAERIATDQFATHNREADENEPHVGEDGTVQLVDGVAEALAVFHGSGMGGAGMPEEVGGMGLPSTVSIAAFAYFQAANVGTAAYPMLTTAAANLLLQHGSQEQIEKWAVPMVGAGEGVPRHGQAPSDGNQPSIASSSSIMAAIIDSPLSQNFGSEASSPKGASNCLWCFDPPAFSMSKYLSSNPGRPSS